MMSSPVNKSRGKHKRRRKEKGKKKRESRVDDVQGFRSQGAHQTLNEKRENESLNTPPKPLSFFLSFFSLHIFRRHTRDLRDETLSLSLVSFTSFT